jgi:hypothetical protein
MHIISNLVLPFPEAANKKRDSTKLKEKYYSKSDIHVNVDVLARQAELETRDKATSRSEQKCFLVVNQKYILKE